MIDERTKMLVETVKRLHGRGAKSNIQKVFLKTHVADIAAVLEEFDAQTSIQLLEFVYTWEDRAKILSYLDEDLQVELVQLMPKETVFKLAALMDSDDLADLLGLIDEELSKEVLNSLDIEESEDVADLMGYPEGSAGSIMSSDYFALEKNHTVEEAIQAIHSEEDPNMVLFYVYVINENEQLVGVLSLKQLLLSPQNMILKDIMMPDVISVSDEMPQDEVAKIVERYDFLSAPVVDSNNHLVGVVTVDDVIDVIREEAAGDLLSMGQAGLDSSADFSEHVKARLPWLILAFIGGLISYGLFTHFLSQTSLVNEPSLMLFVSIIPLILTLSSTAGSQATTTAIGELKSGNLNGSDVWSFLFKELSLAAMFAVLFAVIILALGLGVYGKQESLIVALAVAIQFFVSMSLGALLPVVFEKLNLNPTQISIPVLTVLADLSAIFILFSII